MAAPAHSRRRVLTVGSTVSGDSGSTNNSSHLTVAAAAAAARNKQPALDLDRTRVRKDAQLFLSSISLTGSASTRNVTPQAGPAVADQPTRPAVQTLQRMRAARPAYLHQSRISLTGSQGVPFVTYSVNPFSRAAESRRQVEKTASVLNNFLCKPTGGRKGTKSYQGALAATTAQYVAMDDLLDAPEIGQGKHQKVLKMPSYTVTVVLYVKPEELKKDLNEMWAEKHPDIGITLSKFRSIKRDMVEMGLVTCGLEHASVAASHIYFEKLVSTGRIGKANRKLCAAVCLVIAAKFWEMKDLVRDSLQQLFRAVQERWHMSRPEVLAFEFVVYAELNFDLMVAPALLLSRMERVAAELPEDHPDANFVATWGPTNASKPVLDEVVAAVATQPPRTSSVT